MKKLIFCLILFCHPLIIFCQVDHVAYYQKVMHEFLSNECLSFDMSAIKYADLEGKSLLEQMDFKVIKKGSNWYLRTDDYEMIIGRNHMVSIDNVAADIRLEEKGGVVAADIFSNLTGLKSILDYLQLEGRLQILNNGNTQLDFSASGNNKTKIELEFDPINTIVFRSSATIDVSTSDEIDHVMDGMKIETRYQNVSNEVCQFDEKTTEIVDSDFSVLQNRKSFNNYAVK